AIADVLDERIGVPEDGGPGGVSRYMNQVLPTTVPIAYEDGWLVLRARSLGPATRTPALRPATGPAAAELRTASDTWAKTLPAYVGALYGCGAQPDVPGCLRALDDTLPRAQTAVEAAMPGVRADLTPGCAQLADLAASNVHRLGDAVAAVRTAGENSDPALAQRNDVVKVLHERDAEGYLPRFVALCTATP
ncbi:MAG: hypothetical protein QOF76_387, partial [Solirubrobacteraceae bacterium]|nr:hypothetical protein [Solirubrobacteraceae bacterium]